MEIQKVFNCGSKLSFESENKGYKRKQVGGGKMNNKAKRVNEKRVCNMFTTVQDASNYA